MIAARAMNLKIAHVFRLFFPIGRSRAAPLEALTLALDFRGSTVYTAISVNDSEIASYPDARRPSPAVSRQAGDQYVRNTPKPEW
jgi:hypothetical protein